VYPTPAHGSGHFVNKTMLIFPVLRLLWANFFDSRLLLVRSWSVHVGVKSTKYKIQDFALRKDIRQHTAVDQEISSQSSFKKLFLETECFWC
jgi:hypothetical protein